MVPEDHMQKLQIVLTRPRRPDSEPTHASASSCEDELEYLGYNPTKTGMKPQSESGKDVIWM
jgi:hypothetical protein